MTFFGKKQGQEWEVREGYEEKEGRDWKLILLQAPPSPSQAGSRDLGVGQG